MQPGQDLDNLVRTHVMDVTIDNDSPFYEPAYPRFTPSTSIRHAEILLKHLRDHGFVVMIGVFKDQIVVNGFSEDYSIPEIRKCKTLAQAICLVALKLHRISF
jgi:hypothetical protein